MIPSPQRLQRRPSKPLLALRAGDDPCWRCGLGTQLLANTPHTPRSPPPDDKGGPLEVRADRHRSRHPDLDRAVLLRVDGQRSGGDDRWQYGLAALNSSPTASRPPDMAPQLRVKPRNPDRRIDILSTLVRARTSSERACFLVGFATAVKRLRGERASALQQAHNVRCVWRPREGLLRSRPLWRC